MYGQIHVVVRTLILEKFGEEPWRKILDKSGCDPIEHFMVFHVYDDDVTFSLIGAVSEVLGVPLEAVLEIFGEYFFLYCLRHGYDKMLRTLGKDLYSFIQNLDSLHALLAMSYNNMDAPSFRSETKEDGQMTLHYYSVRPGLYPIVTGLIRSVAKELFDQEVTLELVSQSKERMTDRRTQYHSAFLVKSTSCASSVVDTPDVSGQDGVTVDVPFDLASPLISSGFFCLLFPFHVIFRKDMGITQWGNKINRLSCTPLRSGLTVNKAFKLLQPQMELSFENISKFINAVYIMEIASADSEDDAKVEPKVKVKKGLALKGQMIQMEDTDSIIFIGSPRLADLDELLHRKFYLSDIPLYDVTRELILLNQQRIAEIEVSKKLDETTAALKQTSQALETEKAKTDMLLYQMLPVKVADALREGHQVEAEKFEEVTILFSDIVTFTNIAAAVTPIEVVHMLNQLYRRFDSLSTENGVYKVETIGDAYMVVGGVPIPSATHAQAVANMALGMVESSRDVKSPATGKPLQIRVGVHTGPVVAGVVGEKMPRYCLFGDTVNTASRMESHGTPGRIHVSPSTHAALTDTDFKLLLRGSIDIKGKGKMMTYFLIGNKDSYLTCDEDQTTPETVPTEMCSPQKLPKLDSREDKMAVGAEKEKGPNLKPDIMTNSMTCTIL